MFYLIVLYKALVRMKFTLVVLLLLSFLSTEAQQDHFIYIQTDNGQQFYVKFGDKVYNSTPPGYLVIPKLPDSTYKFIIGFSADQPEKEFTCVLHNRDIGFIIKNTPDSGWRLFNILSMRLFNSDNVIARSNQPDYRELFTDPFSVMLANVVHDSTILQKEPKPAVAENTEVKDSSITEIPPNTVAINTTVKKSTPLNTGVKKKIKKKVTPSPVHKNVALRPPAQRTDSLKTDTSKVVALNNENNQKVENKGTDSAHIAVSDNNQPKDTTHPVTEITAANNPNQPKDTTGEAKNVSVNLQPEQKTEKPVSDSAQQTVQQLLQADSMQNVAINNNTPPKKKSRRKKEADSTLIQKEVVQDTSGKIQPDSTFTPSEVVTTSVIKRRQKKNTKEGIEFVYTDKYGDEVDTVRILLPVEKSKKKEEVVVNENNQQDSVQQQKVITDEEKKIIAEVKNQPAEEKKPEARSTMINSDCKNFAGDDDFLKLRKKMVLEKNDEDMIKVAKKVFKTKCFTTEQIKNLSVLFLTDQGKYMFYDAAYPFVSDSDLYYTLESQLSDNYYITRFRAMIKH